MFSYCIIPYSARSSSFFDGVYEDGVRVRYNNNVKKAFAFSRVLSPSHDLLANINRRLLQGMHEGKNVVLILASSHYISLVKYKENELSSSNCEENNFNACNNISANTSETSTMCIDLCLNLLTHLFDSGHCQNVSATVSMTTVFCSGVMMDELHIEEKKVKSISECSVKEINKTNAATQWAFILQRLQERLTSSTFEYNKFEHSHHINNNNCEDKEESVTTLGASVCVITICFSHFGSVTIIDVDDDALVLQQLATVVAHKVCHVTAISSVQPSFTLTPEHIFDLETITTHNCKQDCIRFISLLESLISGKMHNRYQEQQQQQQYNIDKFDVVHTVAFANPLISETGTLRIMEIASQLNSSLLVQENVISNKKTEESEEESKECIETHKNNNNNHNNNNNNNNNSSLKKLGVAKYNQEGKYIIGDNNCDANNYWEKTCNSNTCNREEPSKNGNVYTQEADVLSKECTYNTTYHHSLPLTESPLSSLSPPPFVTQLSQPPNATVAHNKQCEYSIDNCNENDNKHKCNTDKSYNKTRRTTQLLSPSPFLPYSSASFSSSPFLSHSQRKQDKSNRANGENEIENKEEAHDYVSKNDNKYTSDYYNAYEYSDEGDHYSNKDNVEEISVHLDSDTNGDEEEVHYADESNVKWQNNKISEYKNADGCHMWEITNTMTHDANGTMHKNAVKLTPTPTPTTKTTTTSRPTKNLLLEELMERTKRDLMELKQKYAQRNEHETIHKLNEQETRLHQLHEKHSHPSQASKAHEESNTWQTRFMEHKLRLLEYERQQMQLSKETNEEDVATRDSELRMLREKVHMLEKALKSKEEVEVTKVVDTCGEANATEHVSSTCLVKTVSGNIDSFTTNKKTTSPPSPAAVNPTNLDKSNFLRSERSDDNSNKNKKQDVNCNYNVKVERTSQFCENAAADGDGDGGECTNNKSAAAIGATCTSNNASLPCSSPVAMHEKSETSLSSSPSSLFPSLQTPSLSLSQEYKFDYNTTYNEQQHEHKVNLQERIAAIGIHELRRRNAELEQKIAFMESEIKKREGHPHKKVNLEMQKDNECEQHTYNQVAEDIGVCGSAHDANVCVTHEHIVGNKKEENSLRNICISTESIASTMLECCQSLLEELHATRKKLYMSNVHVCNYQTPLYHQYQSEENKSEMLKKAIQLVDEHIRALHALKLAITDIANRQASAASDSLEFPTEIDCININESLTQANNIDRLFAFEEQRVKCFRKFLPIFVHVCTAAKHVKFRVL